MDQSDNELVMLEVIHRYVELLDKYFGSVSKKINIVPLSYKKFIVISVYYPRFTISDVMNLCFRFVSLT